MKIHPNRFKNNKNLALTLLVVFICVLKKSLCLTSAAVVRGEDEAGAALVRPVDGPAEETPAALSARSLQWLTAQVRSEIR